MVLLSCTSFRRIKSVIDFCKFCGASNYTIDHKQFVYLSYLVAVVLLSGGTEARNLKYVWGDALENPNAVGPQGETYPWEQASQVANSHRIRRSLDFETFEDHIISPEETRNVLLNSLKLAHEPYTNSRTGRKGRDFFHQKYDYENSGRSLEQGCVPSRMCPSTYNTTAPMYGISLTSGKPITIVQKFPDLLQQVVYQVCKTDECDLIHGKCEQTYLPYLFLVIPLGPVTLTGQDYVLVESGCVCRPKYARKDDEPPTIPFIQAFNNATANNRPGSSSGSNNDQVESSTKMSSNKRYVSNKYEHRNYGLPK